MAPLMEKIVRGVDRPWKRKFLGFRLSPEGVIEVSEKAIGKFRDQALGKPPEQKQHPTARSNGGLPARFKKSFSVLKDSLRASE